MEYVLNDIRNNKHVSMESAYQIRDVEAVVKFESRKGISVAHSTNYVNSDGNQK